MFKAAIYVDMLAGAADLGDGRPLWRLPMNVASMNCTPLILGEF